LSISKHKNNNNKIIQKLTIKYHKYKNINYQLIDERLQSDIRMRISFTIITITIDVMIVW